MSGKTKLAVGLDLGASSTRVVICALEDFSTRFLGYGEAPAQAWTKARLSDQEALAESIRVALHEAEKKAQASPDSALIGVGGCVAGINSRGIYEFGRRREIEPGDLKYAVELAARVRLEEDREILQICPQDFTLDGRSGYRNPKGILGARLEANILVVTVSLHEHQAIVSAVHRSHLAVEESVFEGIAAAYASVVPEDRARGAAVVDIGAQSTEVVIYDGDSLLLAMSIPIGADHFTRDVARLFKVNYDFAESLKRQFGSAVADSAPENTLVELPSADGRGMREASCRQLNEILEARAEQIFERVYEEILRLAVEQNLLEGVVITGGGALLPGMCDVAERVMHCQARKGLALGIEDWPAELDNPTWTTAGGLAMYSGRLKLKRDWKRASDQRTWFGSQVIDSEVTYDGKGSVNKMADDLKFLMAEEVNLGTRIKVVGVGGGGSNAVGRMLQEGLSGIEFYILNTDKQALAASPVANKLAVGKKLTSGLGAGADPAVGRQAALEDTEQIIEILEGADMVFVTAGLGGGTGTGAAPVVASLAKELNALTVAVVTKPFSFEGPRRMRQAERGLAELASCCDTVISIPNEKLLALVPKGAKFMDAFRMADDVLRQAVQGIADIITTPGIINRDFSDIRTIMLGMGYAMMGTAIASGDNAPVEAAQKAINSPLMEEGGVLGARGVLINITASSELGIHDVNEACNLIRAATKNEDVQINFGVVMDERMGNDVKVTVIATGFQRDSLPEIDRRGAHFPFSPTIGAEVSTMPVPQPATTPQTEPEPEPLLAPVAAAELEPEMAQQDLLGDDDYEMPALLRKQRRAAGA